MEHSRLRKSIRAAMLAVFVTGALALAACGGSDTTATGSPSAPMSLAASPSPTAEPLPTPTVAGTIAYQQAADIFVVKTDGTGARQLTDDPGVEERPAWSPDGRRIAYGGYPPGFDGPEDASIWIMNADGSGKTRLTKGAVSGIYPSWSPDGKQIAFVRPYDDGYRIFVMNADGSALARVTRPPSGVSAFAAVNDLFPTWLPNGKIVFLRMLQVFEVNPDGSGLRALTKKGDGIVVFALSRDGKKIAVYSANKDSVSVIPTQGGGSSAALLESVSDLIPEPANAAPAWASDGHALALASSSWVEHQQAFGSRLYIVNDDGSGLSAVPGVDDATDPAWRPQ